MENFDNIKQFLIDYDYFTSEELTFINTEKDINRIIYERYAFYDFEQLIHEDHTEQDYKKYYTED